MTGASIDGTVAGTIATANLEIHKYEVALVIMELQVFISTMVILWIYTDDLWIYTLEARNVTAVRLSLSLVGPTNNYNVVVLIIGEYNKYKLCCKSYCKW